jgi:hypothetical protein
MKWKMVFSMALIFLFSGCYTIVWSPEQALPNQSDDQSVTGLEYYDSDYYGSYHDFYGSPWWWSVAGSPYYTAPGGGSTGNRDEGTNTVRNSGDGRNTPDNGVTTPTATRSSNNSNSGNQNKNTNSNTNTRSGNDNNNRTSRNNDGGRK